MEARNEIIRLHNLLNKTGTMHREYDDLTYQILADIARWHRLGEPPHPPKDPIVVKALW